jgi:hypothetical protein
MKLYERSDGPGFIKGLSRDNLPTRPWPDGAVFEWSSWEGFLNGFGCSDPRICAGFDVSDSEAFDLILRWDWLDASGKVPRGRRRGTEYLSLYLVEAEHKRLVQNHRIVVKRREEPAIRAWLESHPGFGWDLWGPQPPADPPSRFSLGSLLGRLRPRWA